MPRFAQPASFADKIRFTGTVRRIAYLARYEGPVIFVHFDPRFVAEIDIQTVTPPGLGIAPGIVHFAIHSPAQLFVTSDPEDKTFDFVLLETGLLYLERFFP